MDFDVRCSGFSVMSYAPKALSAHAYSIRITHGRGKLPYRVEVVFPRADGQPDTSERQPNKAYLEDMMPEGFLHFTHLGQFMHHWTGVEFALIHLLAELCATEDAVMNCIASSMSTKQLIDILNSVATMKLNDEGILKIKNLSERVSKLNSRRNVIVHGHWTLEVVIYPWKNTVQAKVQMLREVAPDDKRLVDLIGDLRNQKERVRYAFTEKRLLGATFDAVKLAKDIGRISELVASYRTAKSGG